MQLIEKFALKYYAFLLFDIVLIYIIHFLHDSHLALSFVGFNLLIGGLFFKDVGNTPYSKEHNRNIFQVGPLVVSCLMTAVMYWLFWINYSELVRGSFFLWMITTIVLSQSVVASIDASHELIHRNETFCRAIGVMNLWFHQFTAYPIEHLYLHHKKVGTTEDPITSPKNKTVYSYYVNAIASAYNFNYKHNKTYFTLCVLGTISYLGFFVGLGLLQNASVGKILLFVLVSYVTIFWMECVEYVEHYGLISRKNKDAPINQICSWNSEENGYINASIFRFERHSDHHMNAYKIFTTLDLNDKMPLFPFDFMHGMIWCLNPKGWFSIMNPLVDKVIEGKEVTKAHLDRIKVWKRNTTVGIATMFIVHAVSKFALT